MKIKSLGYRTDLIFNKFNGEVTDKGEYTLVKSGNVNFFWGNLLLFKSPPKSGDYAKWVRIFKEEFKHPDTYHLTFAWDSPEAEEGEVKEFLEAGYELDKAIVLVAEEVIIPPKFNEEVVVKVLSTDEEFEDVVKVLNFTAEDYLSKETWDEFHRKQIIQYQKMIQAGLGQYFGAFLEGKLVGSLGLFRDKEVGRFQIVGTDPNFQRRGVCSSLVYHSAKYGFQKMGLSTLVMVADEAYHAAKIYESVGFKPTQKQIGLCWYDKERT